MRTAIALDTAAHVVAWFAAAGTIDAVEAAALWRELHANFTAYR